MIRHMDGTTFITADAFRDRYVHKDFNMPFRYASGDLVAACKVSIEARELRRLIYEMVSARKLKLSHMQSGPGRFEYFATKLVKAKQQQQPDKVKETAP